MPNPRELADEDAASLLAVAAACDQTGALSVTDDRYRTHLRTRGRLLVSGAVGEVEGYAGLVDRAGAAYLTDLFVHPGSRDGGHGRALLAALWDGVTERVTSSSQDPRALSGYARYGAVPRWPLLYLRLPGTAALSVSGVEIAPYADGDAGWSLPLDGLSTVTLASERGSGDAAAVVLRRDGGYRVLRARTPRPEALLDIVADLRSRAGAAGTVTLVVPGPHPALPRLLAEGARIEDLDLWCATAGAVDLVDPVRELPSPALA